MASDAQNINLDLAFFQAATSAKIVVPAASDLRNIQPKSFTRTLYPEDNVYEVAWLPPKEKELVVSYTVFWCKYEKDRPHYCEGFLDWEEVPIVDPTLETMIHNITLPDGGNYQMAIAANTKTHSSGLFILSSSSKENNFVLFSWSRSSRNYSSVCIVSRLLLRRPEFGFYLQFAGLLWATCTIIKNRVVGKLKEVSVDGVGETTALVR